MSFGLSSNVFESENFIVKILKEKRDVFIADDKIRIMAWEVLRYLSKTAKNGEITDLINKYTRYNMYPKCTDKRATDWILILHTLNFSLWSSKDADSRTVNGYAGDSQHSTLQ